MHRHVEEAINLMRQRYDEPLTLNDLARAALLSKFHFTRVFRTATGTSPGRFLAAVRFHRAKQLLLGTSMSITDISYRVGYNSLGTFATRFAKCVGMAPGRYRHLARTGISTLPSLYPPHDPAQCGTVLGELHMPPTGGRNIRVYTGVFGSPIIQGVPASHDVVDQSSHYLLKSVPPGEWYVCAAAVEADDFTTHPQDRSPVFFGSSAPISVRPGATNEVDLVLRPPQPFDTPVLLAIPELDSCLPPGAAAAACPVA
ncbi:AraC family transcriptional regulator [Saccharopolyspora sp. NPDC000359]|uniref:AraC family transcriptional regulator n=1 Tax=Saccharopolyspora sp. NPDC000359 TaxID=3154251 RepID=UPI00332B1A30